MFIYTVTIYVYTVTGYVYMQFNELNVVKGAPCTDASAAGHMLSALK